MRSSHARLNVGVLFGGRSAEHEISILSARNVLAALDPQRFEPVPVAITRDGRWLLQSTDRLLSEKGDPRAVRIDLSGTELTAFDRAGEGALACQDSGALARRVDVVFPVLHGTMGEDGAMQGLLEIAGVPYVGAGVLGSAVGMDKDVMKRLLHAAGIPVARFTVLRHNEYSRQPRLAIQAAEELRYPLFVKPANLGSSVGINRVTTRAQLLTALETAFSYDVKAIVEEAVEGREIECAVLGDDEPVASIPGEIVVDHPDGFYSYDAKYFDEHGATLHIPAKLDDEQVRQVQRLSIAAFRVLECSGLARVDFFLRPNGQWLVNEINTLPGFTAISMYPKLWAASGVQPRELITRLIDLALARAALRRSLRTVWSLRR